jgi:hypothetical protein
MVRKKEISIEKLKNHVIDWWVDRAQYDKDIIITVLKDDSIPLDEKELILSGIANGLENLLSLIEPLAHEEDDLVDWMEDFIEEYKMPDPDDEIEN